VTGARRDRTLEARPNVLFEAGMAIRSHPKHTVFVELGDVRSLSDIAGIQTVRLDDSRPKRDELRQQLVNAKCIICRSDGWTKAGDFSFALNPRRRKKKR
jgi:predicted nucleotide-binding protein